ncbi:Ribosomal RNA large subunit methyltransferase J [Gammaproteobacteria bacterium]
MNYQHSFHAGSFADVHKHASLILLLQAMARKEKPFLYLETHAGAGRYDLQGSAGLGTREWESGVAKLWEKKAGLYFSKYLEIVSSINSKSLLRYPGSPWIAKSCLRPRDRMVLLEARFAEAQQLEQVISEHPNRGRPAQVRIGNGYEALRAWLPPPERRGIIFLDPPFEQNNEFSRLANAFLAVEKYFATGTTVAWYPLKDRKTVSRFYQTLEKSGLRRLLVAELQVLPEDVGGRLFGSALLIHNPPWQLDKELALLGSELRAILSKNEKTISHVHWVVGA